MNEEYKAIVSDLAVLAKHLGEKNAATCFAAIDIIEELAATNDSLKEEIEAYERAYREYE